MMGGALGLAVLASLAASRTDSLQPPGHGQLAALTGGYHVAFLVGAVFARRRAHRPRCSARSPRGSAEPRRG